MRLKGKWNPYFVKQDNGIVYYKRRLVHLVLSSTDIQVNIDGKEAAL